MQVGPSLLPSGLCVSSTVVCSYHRIEWNRMSLLLGMAYKKLARGVLYTNHNESQTAVRTTCVQYIYLSNLLESGT